MVSSEPRAEGSQGTGAAHERADRPWNGALGCLVVSVIVFVVYYVILREGRPTFWTDTYEYAQVARDVARGQGLTSRMSYVLEVSMLYKGDLPLPYFLHDVGNSLLMAAFFKVFGASDGVVGWASGTFFMLTPPLTFLLGARLFGQRVGLLAAVLALTDTQLIRYSATGLSEVPYAFLLTLCFYALCTWRAGWGAAWIGVLCGALAVLRSNALPLLPGMALFLLVDRGAGGSEAFRTNRFRLLLRAWRPALFSVGLFLLGFLIAFGPVATRNYRWFGNPLYNSISRYVLIWSTSAIPGKSGAVLSTTGVPTDPVAFILTHPGELVEKTAAHMAQTVRDLLRGGYETGDYFGDACLLLLFLLSILAPPPSEGGGERRLRRLVYASILVAFVAGSMTHIRWRHLYAFIPVALVFVAELLMRIIRQSGRPPDARGLGRVAPAYAVVAFLAVLGIRPFLESASVPEDLGLSREYRAYARLVNENTPSDAVLLTRPARLMYGLSWYARDDRVFIEDGDYTRKVLASQRSRPLFLMVAPRDTGGRGRRPPGASVEAAPPPEGFVPILRWHAEGLSAALFRAVER
jgi:hypothetical protein